MAKSWLFEKINNINKLLGRLRKNEKSQINKIQKQKKHALQWLTQKSKES